MNSERLLTLAGPTSPTAAKLKLTAQDDAAAVYDRTYDVWIVFADSLGQTDAVSVPIRVDGAAPSVIASDPAMNAVSVATARDYHITFSEDMDPSSFTDASLVIEPVSSASGSIRFLAYANRIASFSVSGLSRNTEYSASVSAKDLAGNEVSSSGNPFTYTTTPTYALTYDINQDTDPDGYPVTGSAPVDSNAYAAGESAAVLGNTTGFSRDSHLFAGWNTLSDGNGTTYAAGSPIMFGASDITLYAKWEKKPYRVSYNLNGGTSETITDIHWYSAGETVTVSAALPDRIGYSFMGWSTASNGSVQHPASSTFVISGNTTLYAVWKANLVTSITLSPASILTCVGFNDVTLTAAVNGNPLNPALSWSSNKESVATVTSSGVVSFVSAGTATITATAQDGSGKTASCTVTVNAVYPINSASDFETVRTNKAGHFKMNNSVSLGTWTPIPDFTGEFDGNNVSVHLSITNPAADYQALFAKNNGTIRNLSVDGTLEVKSYAGMLAGENAGLIQNCSSSGTVRGLSDAGGLVGVNNGTIAHCHSSCLVAYISDSFATQIGGLVGNNWTGTIERSYATGGVNGGSGYSVGGLAGYNNSSADINNCYATGNVTGKHDESLSAGTGGLVGTSVGSILYCYATGLVSYNASYPLYFGGILGRDNDEQNTTVIRCYYDISTTGCSDTGKGSHKPTSEMKMKDTYETWSFTNIWYEPASNSYPTLR